MRRAGHGILRLMPHPARAASMRQKAASYSITRADMEILQLTLHPPGAASREISLLDSHRKGWKS